MKIFNRIVVVLLLGGLVALGIAAVLHVFEIDGYRLSDLSRTLGLDRLSETLSGFVGRIEGGNLSVETIVALVAVALLGLVLLILELKPPAPRRVRMQRGTYVTRKAVENEVNTAVEGSPEVLQSNVKVKARRQPGAKVDVRASVRPGEDRQSVQSDVQGRIQRHLDRVGIPVGNLNVQVQESDPRQTKTRVK